MTRDTAHTPNTGR